MSKITLSTGTLHQYTPSGQDIQREISLTNLGDVTVTNVQDDQILKYNTTSNQWENVAAGEVTDLELDELTNVQITGVADADLLKYNSSTQEWENAQEIDGGSF